MRKHVIALAAICAGVTAISGHAAEGGGSIFPHGAENYMAGALPPPGVYGVIYGNSYRATRTNDHDGNSVPIPGFKVEANAVIPRLVWVTEQKVFGGDLAFHTIVPLVDLKVRAGGAQDSRSGLGDITIGTGLGFHHSPQLHSIALLDVIAPTGSYDKNRLANIGKNHWALDIAYALNYVDPKGFNADVKFGYIINRRNSATDYKTGDEFHFDYAAGWGLGNGWTVGAGGYFYQQLRNDRLNGVSLANSKSSALSIGPSVKYDSGKGWFVTVKWEKEFEAKNHTQGNALWLKAAFPL